MLLDFEELFEPYTKDGCTLEVMINWLITEGKVHGFDRDVIDYAMTETFLDIKNGKSYLGKCDCGCSLNNVHTRINHHILKRCKEVNVEVQCYKRQALQENLNMQLLGHIHNQNEQYINEVFPDGVPPVAAEVEAKWKAVLLAQEQELREREKAATLKESELNKKISAFYREREEERSRSQTPRWQIWKRRK